MALPRDMVVDPGKVMRIGSMARLLLEEVRQMPLDEAARSRLADIYQASVDMLHEGLSEDLASELASIAPVFDHSTPSEAEIRVAQAQLVGWLEGLFHGVQATLMAQQMMARNQLEEMRNPELPAAGSGSVVRHGYL